jgi:hypothetical protein
MNEGGDQDLTNLDGVATVMNNIDNEAPENLKAKDEFAEVEVKPIGFQELFQGLVAIHQQ